ncbi:MAG: hypothetical protein P9L94_02295 [Candidatus Hinthialibacter antarcticus]|nr:hypothetical protein [Candidatus Hinthialibacter antarcticus]
MKQGTKAVLSYTLLFLTLVGTAFLLGFEVKHYLYEQTDPLEEIRRNEPDQEEIKNKEDQQKERQRNDILFAFGQTNAFTPLATPVPFPTATPLPPPEPTPIVPGRGFMVEFAARNMCILLGYDKEQRMVRPGDIIEDQVIGNFKILECKADYQNTAAPFSVKVQHVDSGTVRWISEQAPKKK